MFNNDTVTILFPSEGSDIIVPQRLIEKNKYLKKLLIDAEGTSNHNILIINNISASVFEDVLRGNVIITEENIHELLHAAEILQSSSLQKKISLVFKTIADK